jgi:hypothetical protein
MLYNRTSDSVRQIFETFLTFPTNLLRSIYCLWRGEPEYELTKRLGMRSPHCNLHVLAWRIPPISGLGCEVLGAIATV